MYHMIMCKTLHAWFMKNRRRMGIDTQVIHKNCRDSQLDVRIRDVRSSAHYRVRHNNLSGHICMGETNNVTV